MMLDDQQQQQKTKRKEGDDEGDDSATVMTLTLTMMTICTTNTHTHTNKPKRTRYNTVVCINHFCKTDITVSSLYGTSLTSWFTYSNITVLYSTALYGTVRYWFEQITLQQNQYLITFRKSQSFAISSSDVISRTIRT
mmetsp:Transcript_4133/g.10212  ORF Transcript_4133/g.10212 Transcript_4133/m.10212 type:complete len:138 (-) Transcript_4133:806-1219(-)